MSYPKQVKRFISWSKLMVDGATVDREATKSIGSRGSRMKTKSSKKRKRRRRRRRKARLNNA